MSVMKIEFESVLFGVAFLCLVLISLPKEDKENNAPETTSVAQNSAPSLADGRTR